MNLNVSTQAGSGMDLGPFITVALLLFITLSLIWVIPITLNIIQTQPARSFRGIDRTDRTEAAIFCYSLSKETVSKIKALATREEKEGALSAEYLRLYPTHSPVQAVGIVKAYLDIYGAEVGMADSILRSRAAMPTGALAADGTVVPFDFSDTGAAHSGADGGGDSGGGGGD